jgi:hypothetical protein
MVGVVSRDDPRWYGWLTFVTVAALVLFGQLWLSYQSYVAGDYDAFTTDLLFAYVLAMVLAAWLKHRFESPEATFVFSAGGCVIIGLGQLVAPRPFTVFAGGLVALGASVAAYYVRVS